MVGNSEGNSDGISEGNSEGKSVGNSVGDSVLVQVGDNETGKVGSMLGCGEGLAGVSAMVKG